MLNDTEIADLQAKLAHYLSRLERGSEKIDEARARGQDISRWEAVWIGLLGEYEQTYDELQAKGVENA